MSLSAFFVSACLSLFSGFLSVVAWNHTPGSWLCDRCGTPVSEAARKLPAPVPSGIAFSLLFFLLTRCPSASSRPEDFLPAAAVVFALIQLTVCDLRYRILQDQWILFLAGAGLLFEVPAPARAAGLLLPLGTYAALVLAARTARRPPGLGAGDAKLAAGLGFAFGPASMAAILCRAFLLAGIWSAGLLLTKKAAKGDRIPFGPFAAFACYCFLLSTRSM